ncbi:MAG: glycosyltransferase family 4 protein [Acidimicrobiia bacterium]|nr:glycosyltransferase family 4 protein [Acidimicrobiia bacterium]
MKLAIVVQRYGADISGGAELHARYVAEHLSKHAEIIVLTTCARDYVTWRNEFPAGMETVNGIRVERFRVSREREVHDFARRQQRVFHEVHSLQDELRWLDSEGPTSPALVARVRQAATECDYLLFFSVRYYQAYHGARAAADRAVLVPTAERDPALGLAIFGPIFRGVRGIMYNSFEERTLINAVSGNEDVPGVVVGIGSEIPERVEPARARQKFSLENPFVIYVGRIDANKGCAELFDFFLSYVGSSRRPLDLVLIGSPVLQIPKHPRIRHLGFVDDQDKFDAIAAADALVMPSYYESLSMVALEAWALGRPVVANAHCDVLVGQSLRSNAGLYYEDAAEFAGALDALLDAPALAQALGRNGREYFTRHYTWPVIEQTYLDMFARLSSEPPRRRMEPLPGWLERRRRTLPPAEDVVAAIPAGPAVVRRRRTEVPA